MVKINHNHPKDKQKDYLFPIYPRQDLDVLKMFYCGVVVMRVLKHLLKVGGRLHSLCD